MAVAAFAAALDPTAKVTHNARLADEHHRGKRQRDVWIEAKIGGHFPVSILVSCKRHKRKLHSADIDAFTGEIASSKARVGVIYSYSGFSKPAIEKGRVLNIPCCRLYQGKGPEIPSVLSFTSYCCAPQIGLALSPYPAAGWAFTTWQDIFDLRVRTESSEISLLDALVLKYSEAEKAAVGAVASGPQLPQPFQVEMAVQPEDEGVSICVVARGRWKFYRARLEAYEVNGSYEFTHGDFKGQFATPPIDTWSTEPGPGWERLDVPPAISRNAAMIILHHGNTKEALLQEVGPRGLKAADEEL